MINTIGVNIGEFGDGGGYTPPSNWILATSLWNDSGEWIDSETWND